MIYALCVCVLNLLKIYTNLPVGAAVLNACSCSRRAAKPTKRVFDDFGALPLIVIDLRIDPRPRAGLPTPLGGSMRKST